MSVRQQTLDRREAARVLREARRAATDHGDELIDWAFTCMPDRPGPRRLKIQRLLAHGDTEAADALIGQGLLLHPADPSLALLRARSLTMQGQLGEADQELRLALTQRPDHLETSILAARVAVGNRDHPRAVRLLEKTLHRRPDDAIKAMLVGALIEVESLGRASAVLDSMTTPSPVLAARLRRSQGRPLDAVNILREALDVAANTTHQDELLVAMLEVLEEIGDLPGIQTILERIKDDHPRAQLAAARALLSRGDFRIATELIASTAQRPQMRRAALHHLIVAVTQIGRHDIARQSLQDLNAMRDGVDHRLMSECWLRAFRGRIIRRQQNARHAGSDPSLTLLQPLLTDAVLTLENHLMSADKPVNGSGRQELERYRGLCLAALDRSTEAAMAFSRSTRE